MPGFEKSPIELVNFFNETMRDFPQAEQRKTFGYPCAYIHGHMATGLHENNIFLRLSQEDESEFLRLPGATSFAPMMNRPMKGYVVVPEELRRDPESLQSWIQRCLEFVATLPPKEKKSPRARR